LVERRSARKTFIVQAPFEGKIGKRIFSCPIGELFVREKVPGLLPIKRNRQNLPVGGFAVTRTEARGQEGAQRFSCFLKGWMLGIGMQVRR